MEDLANVGIADNRENRAIGIVISVAKSEKPSRTGNVNSAIETKNVTLLCYPMLRPYLSSSFNHAALTGHLGASERNQWCNCNTV